MGWYNAFLEKLFPVKERNGGTCDTVIINIPAELYYKELAIYTATSLIGNAISRSEIKCYANGKPKKNEDYYLLNVSPNLNETSSILWHKVINKMIREGSALVVDVGEKLYCADSWSLEKERPVLGNIYGGVTVGNHQFNKKFQQSDCYVFTLNDVNVKTLIDGVYEEYGSVISAAAKAFKIKNGQKYKIHIDGVKAGDDEFNKEFEDKISAELKKYIQSENAVYPEFDGYLLEAEKGTGASYSSSDYIQLRTDLFKMVAGAMHIPDSMMTGNITNMKEVVSAFLTFGVDPYADMITEGLNKRGGSSNYINGNYYRVDTGKILHQDLFSIAVGISNLISSGVYCIDEVREETGRAPLNTEWSRKHFITKNFEEIEKFLKTVEGGE